MHLRHVLFALGILAVVAFAAGGFWSRPASASNTTGIATGAFHSCAFDHTGRVSCWGDNSSGQLGDGTNDDSTTAVEVEGLQGVLAIAAGRLHTCAITKVGGVVCWGANSDGQLGDGTTTSSNVPVDVDDFPIPDFVSELALGMNHSCARRTSGEVKCWGQGSGGQLGDDSTSSSTTPVYVCDVGATAPCSPGNSNVLTGATSLASGWKHSCAVVAAGAVKCWGWNNAGQLGDDQDCGTGACTTPVDVCADAACATNLTGATDVVAGAFFIRGFSCAVTGSGGVKCWGDNSSGQLGDDKQCGNACVTPVDVCANSACTSNLSGISTISAGGDVFRGHTCAVTTGGLAKCWGGNSFGQLGDGSECIDTQTFCTTPVDVCGKDAETPCTSGDMNLLSDLTEISAGGLHTCALNSDGEMGCFGENGQGQIGDDTTTNRDIIVDIVGLWLEASAITAGDHSCAVTTTGGLQCWGPDGEGQLGADTTSQCGGAPPVDCSTIPLDVSGLGSGVDQVGAGDAHTCIVTTAGAAKCWGDNSSGQIGDGTTTQRDTPVAVTGLGSGVASISVGGSHTCAMTTSGGVKCWGENGDGQLGDGTNADRHTPVNVVGLTSGASAIAAGGRHSCAIATGGTSNVRCWGDGTSGQLGQGQFASSNTPLNVRWQDLGGSANILTAGGAHTCARVTINFIVKCWGDGSSGQLGINSKQSWSVPKQVSGMGNGSGVQQISAGGEHTCAVVSTDVKCWGDNSTGQVGDNTTTQRDEPVLVLEDAPNVAAGLDHTCARTNEDGIMCWGKNSFGQVGDGSVTERHFPQEVLDLFPKPLPSCGPGASGVDFLLMLVPVAGLVATASWRWRRGFKGVAKEKR